MKSNKLNMDWKDRCLFNGFIAKVIDFDGVDKFKISIHKDGFTKTLLFGISMKKTIIFDPDGTSDRY